MNARETEHWGTGCCASANIQEDTQKKHTDSPWESASGPGHVAVLADMLASDTERDNGMPASSYRAGVEHMIPLFVACLELGIPVLTLGLTASDQRTQVTADQAALLQELVAVLEAAETDLQHMGVAIHLLGSLHTADARTEARLQQIAARTHQNTHLALNLVVSYDSRAEIARALQQMRSDGIGPEQVTEALLSSYLLPNTVPDPDLIIQTGGTLRLGNFLLWQAAYAEYYAAPVSWLDFDHAALQAALAAYIGRERRFGSVLVT
jgi:undecaprenyl diphosphate synthase